MKYCTVSGKEGYRTRGAALKVAKRMEQAHKGSPSVYLCPACCRWHLTHYSYRDCHNFTRQPPKRKKKPMKIKIETASNDEVEISIKQTEEEKPRRYIGLMIEDSVNRRAALLTYEQACELVEALKIQIAKL